MFAFIPVGTKVKVDHGTGTIEGYSSTTYRPNPRLGTNHKISVRYAIKLDEGHTWSFKDSLYYEYEKNLTVIDNE